MTKIMHTYGLLGIYIYIYITLPKTSMEPDGMDLWKTIFLYNPVDVQVLCQSSRA